jgi:hypothetical protein
VTQRGIQTRTDLPSAVQAPAGAQMYQEMPREEDRDLRLDPQKRADLRVVPVFGLHFFLRAVFYPLLMNEIPDGSLSVIRRLLAGR